jgi:ABC-type cobalamin/Fe3+-siderophores transport system ATPase subunit
VAAGLKICRDMFPTILFFVMDANASAKFSDALFAMQSGEFHGLYIPANAARRTSVMPLSE